MPEAGRWLSPDDFPDPEPYPDPFPASERASRPSQPAPPGTGDYSTLDVVAWFQRHGLWQKDLGGGKHAVECPWEDLHTKKQAAGTSDTVVWEGDGVSAWPRFCCQHSHCTHRKIEDVLSFWDDASDFCQRQFPTPSRPAALNGHEPAKPMMTLAEARELVGTVRERMKEDPRAAFEGLSLYAFGLLRKCDGGEWSLCKQAFSAARIGVRDIERQLPAVELAEEDREPEEEIRQAIAGNTLPGCPAPNLIIPHPYMLSELMTGIREYVEGMSHPVIKSLAPAPILLTGLTRNPVTGDESLRLTWKWKTDEWKSRIVERQQALSIRKLSELSGVGFPVSDISAGGVVEYLYHLEAVNRPTLPTARVTSQLGWQGKDPNSGIPFLIGRSLILPDGSRVAASRLDAEDPDSWSKGTIFFHSPGEGEEQIVDAFHEAGEFETWLKAVSVLRHFPKALIGFYAAFASPLLQVFNVPNFALDYANRTSTGKTTILRVAGSVWGNPDERTSTSLVGTWDATRVWAERAGHIMNGLPLILDDTMKARNDRAIVEQIYAVISGRGRGRGTIGGIAQTANWRTILFSSGEQPATSKTQDGGTRTRVLSFVGLPFEKDDQETGRMIKRLNQALCENFGHPGILFMSWLQQNRHTWPEWKERYQALVETFSDTPPSPEAGRLAQYAALVVIGGEMAHRALGLPWEFSDPFQTLWGEVAKRASDAAGDERALQYVVDWARGHHTAFHGRLGGQAGGVPIPNEVYGRWDRDDWKFIGFYQHKLDQLLKDQGFNPEMVYRNWKERGWIRTTPEKFSGVVKVGGKPERMVIILRSGIEEIEGEDESEED